VDPGTCQKKNKKKFGVFFLSFFSPECFFTYSDNSTVGKIGQTVIQDLNEILVADKFVDENIVKIREHLSRLTLYR
jgi:hypothetical protein